MSPVSRGRRGKKSDKKRKRSTAPKVTPRPGVQQPGERGLRDALTTIASALPGFEQARQESRSWWPGSHADVLAQASNLLDCTSPDELEDAVCLLLGRHWTRLFDEHDRGLVLDEWLEALIEAAEAGTADPAVRRLLHGVAAIATPGLAGLAVQVLSQSQPSPDEPDWLPDTHQAVASPHVLLLRDGYGLRFGVLIEMTGPRRPTRVYLLDVDQLAHQTTDQPARPRWGGERRKPPRTGDDQKAA